MRLDGTLEPDSEVTDQKSDFNLIPVQTRSGASRHSRERADQAEERPRKKERKGGKAGNKK